MKCENCLYINPLTLRSSGFISPALNKHMSSFLIYKGGGGGNEILEEEEEKEDIFLDIQYITFFFLYKRKEMKEKINKIS